MPNFHEDFNERVLFRRIDCNIGSGGATGDLTLPIVGAVFNKYIVTKVIGSWYSGGASVACLAGLYSAAAKGGTQIAPDTTSWLNLTATGTCVILVPNGASAAQTLAAAVTTSVCTTTFVVSGGASLAVAYLNIGTLSTAACKATIEIYGYPQD
jgi:hypothetical protein